VTEQERKQKIYHFKREMKRACGGMEVQRGRTINVSTGGIIDHYELSVPESEEAVVENEK